MGMWLCVRCEFDEKSVTGRSKTPKIRIFKI